MKHIGGVEMKNNIYLLIICPYIGMKEVVNEIISQQENVFADLYIANLDEAAELVQKINMTKYDAIVSRGGTADMLKEISDLPVIDIGLSGMDVLRAIRLAQNFNQDFVVVGFDTITKHANSLNEVLQMNIPVYTIHSAEESMELLKELKTEGIDVVVCDVITMNNALTLNQNPVLISSGYASISDAIENAVYYSQKNARNRTSLTVMLHSHHFSPYPCVIFDSDKNVYYSSLTMEQNDILNYLKDHIEEFDIEQTSTAERMVKNMIVTITNKKVNIRGEEYLYLYMNINELQENRKIDAIRVINGAESLEIDKGYYYSSHLVGSEKNILEKYGKTSSPVLISGEAGTGKDQAAMLIYGFSSLNNNLCYQIDCKKMNDRNWNFLLNSHESPLAYKKKTIYIKNFDAMPQKIFSHFIALLVDSKLHKRNRLILSTRISKKQGAEFSPYFKEIMGSISCLTIYLPSLVERIEDIPVLSTYYINRMNIEFNKQIIGFDSKAMQAMKKFPWEANLAQLKRIIHELMLVTNTSYISYENTMRILRKETPVWSNSETDLSLGLDLNQTLDKIDYDIIRYVLSEENNNHTKTANRLGISRSTLWRILKQYKES